MRWKEKNMAEEELIDAAFGLEPEDIKGSKNITGYLIFRQIDRINFLITQGMARGDDIVLNELRILPTVKFGLYTIEKLLSPDLSKDYKKNVAGIKEEIKASKTPDSALEHCMEWYEVLINEFPGELLPRKKMKFKFQQ